jgi:hypothetical protein
VKESVNPGVFQADLVERWLNVLVTFGCKETRRRHTRHVSLQPLRM